MEERAVHVEQRQMGRALAYVSGRVVSDDVAELSIIVPTFNERDNVAELVRRLEACLEGTAWEVIFVDDDSTDGTADRVREMARRNPRVRCLQRIGRRGLASACIEGMLASAAPYLAVIDGDCQHDETILPSMLEALKTTDTDLVVGSRYMSGGGTGNWEVSRAKMSKFATRLSRIVAKRELSDPMSGFFALRREVLGATVRDLSSVGFKILLDIVATHRGPLNIKEIPYEFRGRHAGESKLDSQAVWSYLMLLADKASGQVIPARLVSFVLVGAVGVLVHFAVLSILFRTMSLSFASSQALAALVAMTNNYALNNALTYRDKRRTGWGWVKGWASFTLVCSLGALGNVGVASYLFAHHTVWIPAAAAGIIVGTMWNYAMTGLFTWAKEI